MEDKANTSSLWSPQRDILAPYLFIICLDEQMRPRTNYYGRGGARGGARGVMVIVVRNEDGDTSSNPGRD